MQESIKFGRYGKSGERFQEAVQKLGKLKPDDTQGGTYTVTNVGTFGSVFGTPIINQPQVGILALGAIRKVPAVMENSRRRFHRNPSKNVLIALIRPPRCRRCIRRKLRKRVAEYLEAFDVNRDY